MINFDLGGWTIDGGSAALGHGVIVFASLLVYVLVSRIGHHRRQPSAAVAWVLLIAMLPYVGLPLFLTFGTRKVTRPGRAAARARATALAQARAVADAGLAGPLWADDLLQAMAMPPAVANATVEFHGDGARSRAALLELIDGARDHLDVCTFILGNDAIGDDVIDALAGAARRGVRVRLLVDAFGSLRLARQRQRRLVAAGVSLRHFMPILHHPLRGRTNLRNHRKLAVADGERLWSGGRNLAAEYFGAAGGEPAWVDLSFSVTGPLARQAEVRFESDWVAAHGQRMPVPVPFGSGAPATVGGPVVRSGPSMPIDGPVARLVPSGPDLADDTVYALVLTAAFHARRRLLAVTPYFVPDDALLSALTMAARRGIAITLIVPARSNYRLADLARPEALRQMARAGVRVMLYPTMIHAKALVVDDSFALCGSVNLDGRSLFLNYELMVAFHGQAEVAWLADWLQARARESVPYVAARPSWSRDLIEGMVRAVGYQL